MWPGRNCDVKTTRRTLTVCVPTVLYHQAVCLNRVPTIRGCGGQVVVVLASRVTLFHWLYARSANLYKQFNCVEGPILSGYHSGGLLVDLLIRNKLVVSLSWWLKASVDNGRSGQMCADAGCPDRMTKRVCSPSSLGAQHCFINNIIIIYHPLNFRSEMIWNILILCSF